ncbi:MAG: type II toxin-antitoxin system Phd/YefM family antitoxin [Janthinobacterium lividum]
MTIQTRIESADPVWKLEDAKARFSEVVRLARDVGPQRVTVRGQPAVVVVAADEYDRLSPPVKQRSALDLFAGLELLGDLDIERDRDTGRDIEF